MWTMFRPQSIYQGIASSTTQSTLNSVLVWTSDNWMKLNVKKCKELRVCSLNEFISSVISLTIDGHALETVRSQKVLGLTIQNNLKWDEHIFSTVSKASKRLHILRVLRLGGVHAVDFTVIYVALIRSILEYCGITPSPAICLTILKEYKSELCVYHLP